MTKPLRCYFRLHRWVSTGEERVSVRTYPRGTTSRRSFVDKCMYCGMERELISSERVRKRKDE